MNSPCSTDSTHLVGRALAAALAFLAQALPAEEARRFQHGASLPGSPVEAVLAVAQDSRGFLWFGSEDALYRWDGFDSEVFRHDADDPRSPSASAANDLLVDRTGTLWIATPGGGLDRFLDDEERFESFRHHPEDPGSLSDDNVFCLLEDHAGALWAGTERGLDRFDREQGRFAHLLAEDTATGDALAVHAVFEDRSRQLWVGTERGLFQLAPESGSVTRHRHRPDDPGSLSHDRVHAIRQTGDGGLWVATEAGLNRLDPATGKFRRFLRDPADPESPSYDLISDLHVDGKGDLWIGTFGGGLDRYHPSTGVFDHYRHDPADPDSLSGNGVVSLFEDSAGVLWIGTYGGLNKYDPRHEQFEIIGKRTLGSLALAVWEDPSGLLWVGSTDRLLSFDRARGIVTAYEADADRPGALPPGYVGALLRDRSGTLWVGTWGGLCSFEEDRGEFECLRPDLRVYSLFEDSRGRLWVGAARGLWELDPDRRHWRSAAELPDAPAELAEKDFNSTIEDRSGTLWFASDGGGLYRLQDARFDRFRHDPADAASLSSDRVVALHEDRRGEVWAATWSGGLNRLDPRRGAFVRYGEQDGLPSSTVTGILEDERGFLWLGTYDGLSRFDPETETCQNFDVSDGLAGNVLNIYSYFRSRRGEMFFGSEGGLNAFFPDRVAADPRPPPVALTEFRLFDRPAAPRRDDPASPLERSISATREIVLTHRQGVFAFEFAALDYRAPRKNKYAYELEGFDRDWIPTDSSQRFARYTNLDPGDYVFRVKASNASGVWNEEGASVAITILPPPWKTWWAYSLYTLAFGLVTAGAVRAQRAKLAREREEQRREIEHERRVNERLREVDRLKDEFLANTSHELRTPLYGMIGLAEGLHDGARGELPDAARTDLGMLIASSRRLAALVNDILDFSRLKQKDLDLYLRPVDLKTMVDVVLAIIRPLVDRKTLALESAVPADLPPVRADENRLQQILLNLVGNALKFTEEGTVEVSAELDGDRVRVRVRDTGIGIAPGELKRIFGAFEQADASSERLAGGTGLGLAISEKLVTLHGGEIWVESTLGEGSSFFFTLPVADTDASAEAPDRPPGAPLLPALIDGPAVAEGAVGAAADGLRILVVDDEPVNRQVLLNHLATRNFSLTAAGTGPEALHLLAESDYDLVLLDIMMPRMSGFEVCQRIRQERRLEELPVIFLTAKNQTADRVEGFDAGANDYLVKPIAKGELLARVNTHLELATAHRLLRAQHSTLERQAAELRARNAELVSFTTAVSHDLRNPLTTIRLFLGLLERDIDGGDTKAGESVEHIRKAALTMEELMGDLVELSRIGRQAAAFEVVDLGEIAREAAALHSEAIVRRRARLEIDGDLPVLRGDRQRLRGLLSDLVDNALKFSGGVAEPGIEIGQRRDGGERVFFVADNGIGIAPRYHELVFGIFEQLDREAEGTGIGLAMARRVVEAHGGRIWIESEGEGRGSTVCFTLRGDGSSNFPAPP